MVTSSHQGSVLAGLAARLSPLLLRQQAEDQRILVEDADMEKIMSRGLGPHDVLDDKHEVHLQAIFACSDYPFRCTAIRRQIGWRW